ncbi:MAG: PleD family two-component system response regulator [Alphaproteobacteria bacterium]|nr:PleD family two-component system response regulator [Alphaproteobacteria bacterium]
MTARVLVVDDLPQNVKLLEAKLTSEYFNVLTANSGSEALEIIEIARPDIVLLDVMMPEMDGFEVCRNIKSDPKTAHIPVVMITALSDVSDRVRGLEAGADDFLTKPVTDVPLFARIRSLVRLKMAMDELRLRQDTSEQLGAVAGEDAIARDITGARVLLVEDDELSAELIAEFAAESDIKLQVVQRLDRVSELGAQEPFDLIMCSADLATGDALRLVSELRSDDATRTVPILLLIREEDNDRLAKALEIGINDYLVRPINREELVARMRSQVRRKRYQDRLRATYRESMSMAVTDPLTGVYNRRYFDVHVEGQQSRAASLGKPLALLMIDIDRFKQINDSHGHAAGDEVLAEIANRIVRHVRNFDMVARLGGEEFVVVMPETDEKAAHGVAERLREAFANRPVKTSGPAGEISVTASIGVAVSEDGSGRAQHLLARADGAMYEAKRRGRNRVVLARSEGATPAVA